MRSWVLFVAIFSIGVLSIAAQQPTPQPTPQSTPQSTGRIILPTPSETTLQRQKMEADARFAAMRSRGSADSYAMMRARRTQIFDELYREPKNKELRIVAPDPNDLKTFSAFLKHSNTGLIKLVKDYGCDENTKVVVATEECLKYPIPGSGASYSFRIENYRIRRLADLTFSDDQFSGFGVLNHSILVGIGDVPINEVTLKSTGMKFLTDFEPDTDFEKAKEFDKSLSEGIEKDGFVYRRSLPALENTTYALRSVAYKGSFVRSITGIPYNELDFDKRVDVIIAFRIVRRDEDGSVTILWKELDRKNSPKVKQPIKDYKLKQNEFTAGEIAIP